MFSKRYGLGFVWAGANSYSQGSSGVKWWIGRQFTGPWIGGPCMAWYPVLAKTVCSVSYCDVKVDQRPRWIHLRQREHVKLFVLSRWKVVDLANWRCFFYNSRAGIHNVWWVGDEIPVVTSQFIGKPYQWQFVRNNPRWRRAIVVTGALLSEINRRPSWLQIAFHILYFHQKLTKDGSYHKFVVHWVNFQTNS